MYLLEHMIRARMPSLIVMMTGHGDVPLAVKAIKLGAFDFLEKPFDDVKLVSILQNAFVQLAERTVVADQRSEEHTSELQSLMRISFAVICLKKKITNKEHIPNKQTMTLHAHTLLS